MRKSTIPGHRFCSHSQNERLSRDFGYQIFAEKVEKGLGTRLSNVMDNMQEKIWNHSQLSKIINNMEKTTLTY